MKIFLPVVSIIVPIYNTQKFLTRCIESVLSQSYKHFELILVDDGSTDLSPVICDNYKCIYPYIKVVHKENGGLASARNTGLDVATGDYIYFVDSDDYIDEQLLKKAIDVLIEHPADCLAFGMTKEDEEGRHIEDSAFLARRIDITDSEREAFILSELLNYRVGWEACSRIFKADIIREHNLRFVNERKIFAEDLLFSFNYWLYASSIEVLHDCPYHYIQRSSSLMDVNRQTNNLRRLNALVDAAYDACIAAGNNQLAEDFAVIYHHLIEWHARPYIAAGEYEETLSLEAALSDEFFSKHAEINRFSMHELAAHYGDCMHYVSVCIPISGDNINKTLDAIEVIKHQSLQKTEIAVISDSRGIKKLLPEDVLFAYFPRIKNNTIKKFIRNRLHGRYVYIYSPICELAPNFLEKTCDVIKYNFCNAFILADEDTRYISNNSAANAQTIESLIDNTLSRDMVMLRNSYGGRPIGTASNKASEFSVIVSRSL